jgi:hypothetical protein
MMMRSRACLLVMSLGLLVGCETVHNTVMEKVFKKEKRELLTASVKSVQKSQQDAQVEFKDAMTQLKELYAFQGGDLEKTYDKLKASYDDASSRAETVHKRVANMESVARAMFAEWEKEIRQYSNPTLAANSRTQLADTKARYNQLDQSLKESERSMQPVLRQLNDHVLYLKHNLNASAIGSLKGEAVDIQGQIEELIRTMNAAIAEADAFISTFERA